MKLGKWNRYEVIAQGHRIRTFINRNLCVDLDDPQGATRGIIAFQLYMYSGGKTEMRFRNLKLERLTPTVQE